MKKIIIATFIVAILISASPALAQTDVLVVDGTGVGLTPASPFFFIEKFFEGVGTFFIFGDEAKAERHLYLAEKRLAEAKVLAERGDEKAQAAVALYEDQFTKAKERAERKGLNAVNVKTERQAGDPIPDIDISIDQATRNSGQDTDGNGSLDLLARITDATTKHLLVLDEVYEKVPEQAKASIQAARERSMTGQIEALRDIAERDPEVAIDIFARAAEGRLNAVQARAGAYIKIGSIEGEAMFEEDDEDMEEREEKARLDDDSDGDGLEDGATRLDVALKEFEKYAAFGNEISALAQGIRTGETTVDELVQRATSHHLDVLRDVQSKVPPQARESIERTINGSRPNADLQTTPASRLQPQRIIPENSIERAPANISSEARQRGEGEIEEEEIENENEVGGRPEGVPSNIGERP